MLGDSATLYTTFGCLLTRTNRKPMPETHCMFYMGCLVLALEHLRERAIVHRSVRPENVLIDEYGNIRLGAPSSPKHLYTG